jgi:hypothetical protein
MTPPSSTATGTPRTSYLLQNSQNISAADHSLRFSYIHALSSPLPPPSKHHRCVKTETVFALGVALLELSWRRSLLSLKTPNDLNDQGLEDSLTELSIATRLADEMHT